MEFTIREAVSDDGLPYVHRENIEDIVSFLIKHMCSLERQGAPASTLSAAIRCLSEVALAIKLAEARKSA